MNIKRAHLVTSFLQRHIVQRASLVLRATVFSATLIWATIDPRFLTLAVFILVSVFAYFKPVNNSHSLLWLFVVLLLTAPHCIDLLTTVHDPRSISIFSLFFGFLFYSIVAIKKRVLLNRQQWHYFVYLTLLYILYIGIFFQETEIGTYILVYLAIYLMTQEFFINHQLEDERGSKKFMRIIGATTTVLLLETVWIVHFLPLSTVQAATTALVVSFVIIELVFRYLQNELAASRIKYYALVAFLFGVIITLTTQWQL